MSLLFFFCPFLSLNFNIETHGYSGMVSVLTLRTSKIICYELGLGVAMVGWRMVHKILLTGPKFRAPGSDFLGFRAGLSLHLFY